MNTFKEFSWDEVREEVRSINPDLFESIEQLSPSNRFALYKVRYRFGDLISERGTFKIPDENGKLLPISESALSAQQKNNLSYSSIPLFLILKNACEVFVTPSERAIPMIFAKAGRLVGLFETFDFMTRTRCKPFWDITAGARSIFMLPQITEKQGINRLMRTYKLPHNIQLKQLSDHWEIFKKILSYEKESSWYCEILVFSKQWFEFEGDQAWSSFYRYIFKQGWQSIQYTLNQVETGFIWQALIDAVEKRNLKPRHYIADTVRHLFAMAVNRYPGFAPIDDEQDMGPIKELQNIFIETYGLKQYFPTMMGPHMLSYDPKKIIYYSLSLPTLIEGTVPHLKKSNRVITDLREIKLLIETFKERSEFLNQNEKLRDIEFDFFHSEKDINEEMQQSGSIIKDDDRFIYENSKFCQYSPFWCGCIRMRQL